MARDAVKLAIEHALKLREVAAGSTGKVGEGLTTRAREFPSLALSAGLVPALAFYLAKAVEEKDALLATIRLLKCGSISDAEENTLLNALGGGEGKGYPIIVGALAVALDELAGTDMAKCDSETPEKDIAQALKDLREGRPVRESVALGRLLPYAESFKRMIEALFPKKPAGATKP